MYNIPNFFHLLDDVSYCSPNICITSSIVVVKQLDALSQIHNNIPLWVAHLRSIKFYHAMYSQIFTDNVRQQYKPTIRAATFRGC